MRIWEWFLRRIGIDTDNRGACDYCASPLLRCPDCQGNWRAHRCRSCSLGLCCPTHRTYWLAC